MNCGLLWIFEAVTGEQVSWGEELRRGNWSCDESGDWLCSSLLHRGSWGMEVVFSSEAGSDGTVVNTTTSNILYILDILEV